MKNVTPIIMGILLLLLTILTITDTDANYVLEHQLNGSVKGVSTDEYPLLKRVTDNDLIIYSEGTVYYQDVIDELTPDEKTRLNSFIDELDDYQCGCKNHNNYNIYLFRDGKYQLLDNIEQYKMDEFNLLIEDIIK